LFTENFEKIIKDITRGWDFENGQGAWTDGIFAILNNIFVVIISSVRTMNPKNNVWHTHF
jgi:hypothetical protein